MKYFLRVSFIVMMLLGGLVFSTDAGTLEVYFRDQNVRHTLFTLYEGQIEYVHLNKIADVFRLSVNIDSIDGRVVLRYSDKSASFFPGQASVIANRRTHFLDVPPRKIEGIIMVPLQFLTTILPMLYDGKIIWDPGNRRFVVETQVLKISDLSFSPYGDYTRILVEMNQSVSYKVSEKLPSLLIFELPHLELNFSQNPLEVNSRSVKHVKVVDSFGTTQIIIRLASEFDRYTHQLVEDPPRMVIDVYNTSETPVEAQISENIIEEDILVEPEQVVPMTQKRFALRTVVIDPGHGGSDPGIIVATDTGGSSELFEKEITLQIAKLLKTSLAQRFGRVRIVLTREGDDFVSPETRTTIANSNRADVFISLHVNNNPSVAVSGFEVYIMDYGSVELPVGYESLSAQSQLLDYAQARYVRQSERLAEQIVTAYKNRNIAKNCKLKRAPLFTLKGATMPAVHVEMSYASHSQEQRLINQLEFQQVLVAAITDGIAAFKKNIEENQSNQ